MNQSLIKNTLEELEYIPIYDETQKFWTTFDLGCSAALISLGFQLVTLEKSNSKKVQFVFRREDRIEKTVANYWSDQLVINARTFFDNLKALKNQIYSR